MCPNPCCVKRAAIKIGQLPKGREGNTSIQSVLFYFMLGTNGAADEKA